MPPQLDIQLKGVKSMNKKRILKVFLLINLLFIGSHVMAQSIEETNQALIGKFAEEVFANKDLSNLEQYMQNNYIQHNPLVEQGSEGFKAFFEAWFIGVPDFGYTLKNIIASDDYVWVYGNYTGTQTGDWLGIPASNKTYSFDAVDIFRISDGKLAEHWDVLDIYSLFKQLGTIQ